MYCKVGSKWRYCKPAEGRNHKLKPGYALISGEEQYHPGAAYFVRWRDGAKTIWRKCSTAADAESMCKQREAYLNALAHGLTFAQQNRGEPTPVLMVDALPLFLEEYRLSHRPESHGLMEQTLNEFNGWCRKNLVEKITRVDLLRYRAWLIDKKRSPRTAANKMLRVAQFLRTVLKQKPGEGVVTVKDARFTELEPTVYNSDELAAFFKECNPFQFAVFRTYLQAGLRKAELENLEWTDVDFTAGVIRVTPKKDWQPKTWEARTIEVPDELLTILKELPRRGKLVFANASGHKFTHSWDDCKAIGKKAKVEDCHPHKFRATFATRNLQNGIDLKTVQALLGHRDIASTMRYLAKAESKKVRAKVNAVWA
jgi:integrase/recombinase XerD